MFFEKNLLTRRGKFGVIWIAATRPTGLRKRDYITVNVQQQCRFLLEHILQRQIRSSGTSRKPKTDAEIKEDLVKFSLYLSAQLMYGVVRVFAQQHVILLEDVNSAMVTVTYQRHSTRSNIHINNDDAGKAGGATSGLNLNDDLRIHLQVDNEADLLLMQHINTPFIPDMFPNANFEMTTDLETNVLHSLTPPDQSNHPYNAPIENDGMDPQDPLDLFGIFPIAPIEKDKKRQRPLIEPPILAESDEFRSHYGRILDDEPMAVPEIVVQEEGGPEIPAQVEVEVEQDKKRRVKAVKPTVLRDRLENASQHPRPAIVNYAPENPYARHEFSFTSTNFPSQALNMSSDLVDDFFTDRCKMIDMQQNDPLQMQEQTIPDDDFLILPANETDFMQPNNVSVEEARAGSVHSRTSSTRVSNHQQNASNKRSSTLSGPRLTDQPIPQYEEPQLDDNILNQQNQSLSLLSDNPLSALQMWLVSSHPNEEERFSSFCIEAETTCDQAADTFIALLFQVKKGLVTLFQEESFGEIFIRKN